MTSDADRVVERRLPHWWDKWVNPTTVLTLIGGIVWGVQLNMMVVTLAAENAAGKTRDGIHDQLLQDLEINMAKHTLLIDGLIEKQKDIKEEHQLLTDHILENGLNNSR